MAEWLNSVFSGFDYKWLSNMHALKQSAGGIMTPLMNFISLFGNKGLFSIILSIVLILFKKTRKTGVTAILAVGISALICNVILKPLVARPRPYTVYPFNEWWQAVGANAEKDLSFPSGHVNNITALSVALFIAFGNKKFSWIILLAPFAMCFSRTYLMVHYPTDVLFAILTGTVSGIIAFFVTKGVYCLINTRRNKFTLFFKNASIVRLFHKTKK